MIVLDASAAIALLVPRRGEGHVRIVEMLRSAGEAAVPHLIDAEAGQVIRRFERAGELTEVDARAVLDDLASLPLVRYPHAFLTQRAFDLRGQVTFYDALYVALAEALDLPLVTTDTRLGRAAAEIVEVEVVEAG